MPYSSLRFYLHPQNERKPSTWDVSKLNSHIQIETDNDKESYKTCKSHDHSLHNPNQLLINSINSFENADLEFNDE